MLRDEGYELTLAARRPEPLEEAAGELGATRWRRTSETRTSAFASSPRTPSGSEA